MSRLLILFFSFPFFIFCQSLKSSSKSELAKVYSQAIQDFINDSNKKNKYKFDTIFIARRKFGQPDDFPCIELPEKIWNTQVRLITLEDGIKSQSQIKSRIYINILGWVNNEKAEFLFIVFSNGFVPQYNYSIHYIYSSKSKKFELEKSQFNYPPFDK